MIDPRPLRRPLGLGFLLAIALLAAWITFRPKRDRVPAPNNSPAATSQPTRLPQDAAARDTLVKRSVAEAFRFAAAENLADSLRTIERLLSVVEAELLALPSSAASTQPRPAATRPASPASLAAAERLLRNRNLLELDRRALHCVKADLRLIGGELSESQWLAIYTTSANQDLDSAGRLLERTLAFAGPHWPVQRLWTLLGAKLPASARASLAAYLGAYHSPDDQADLPQLTRFYETLIARCIDVPAVADGLLERYIQELDRRDASAAANAFLWNLLRLLPDSQIGAKAAILLIAAQSGPAKDQLLRDLWTAHPNTELARTLLPLYLDLLTRQRQFVRVIQLLDAQKTLAAADTRDSLLVLLANLIRNSGRASAVAFSQRRSTPIDASVALLTPDPVAFCVGLAEELTGATVDASQLELDAFPTTQPSNRDPLRASLLAILDRTIPADSFEQTRETLLADLGKPPTTQPATRPASQQAYELAWQAHFLNTAGKLPDALRLCRQTIQNSAADPDSILRARTILIELLMEQQPLDASELDTQLAALKTQAHGLTASSWNLATRVLFRRVLSSPPHDRQAVWNRALRELAQDSHPLSEQTLADLDQFLPQLGGGSLSALAATTDLLLFAHDIPTMARLQSRRLNLLLAGKAWPDVTQAIRLDILLACFTEDGPFDVLRRDVELAQVAGMPDDQLQQLESIASAILPPDSSVTADPRATAATPPIDAPLQQAARAQLHNLPKHSSRGRAWALLCADNAPAAIRALHFRLTQAQITPDVLAGFDDIALALAVADGSYHNAARFTHWLIDHATSSTRPASASQPAADLLLKTLIEADANAHTLSSLENDARSDPALNPVPTTAPIHHLSVAPAGIRIGLASAALRRSGERAIAWGIRAMAQGHLPAAQAAWAFALNLQRHPGTTATLTELIVNHLLSTPSDAPIDHPLKILESILPRLHTTTGRQRLQIRIIALHRQQAVRLAKTHFDEGNYVESLATLDQLDKAWPLPQDAADMPTGFIRALCLIRLEKLVEAADLLGQMESWPGSPEQHARALFLTGWIHLQADNQSKAVAAFQRLASSYPQTSFASKAKDMLANLE